MPRRKTEDRALGGAAELAGYLGVAARRVQQLTKEGIIKAKSERPYRYDIKESCAEYIQYLTKKAQGRLGEVEEVKSDEIRKLKAEADYKEAKAKIAQLELEELEGKLHSSEDVEAVFNGLLFATRSAVIALPGRVAMDIVKASNANEASTILRDECYKMLRELESYRYDKEDIKKRSRERRGWADVKAEDEEA